MKSRTLIAEADAGAGLFRTMRSRFETRVVLGFLALLGLVWAGLGVAEWLNPGFVAGMDATILRSFRQGPELEHVIGPGAVEHAVLQLTSMGGSSVVTAGVGMLMGVFLLTDRLRYTVRLGFAVIGGAALGDTFNYTVPRLRAGIGPHLMPETSWSFPSGHATITAVIFTTLALMLAQHYRGRLQKLYIMSATVTMIVLIGWTRLAMGVHYPTDILGGWTLGLSWALVTWMLGYYLDRGRAARFGIAGAPEFSAPPTGERAAESMNES